MNENNERSRLDEAVEAAIRKWYADDPGHKVEAWQVEYMRAALLAGVKVLLGEPVGWMLGGRFFDTESEAVYEGRWENATPIAVYAPSLGEGGYE